MRITLAAFLIAATGCASGGGGGSDDDDDVAASLVITAPLQSSTHSQNRIVADELLAEIAISATLTGGQADSIVASAGGQTLGTLSGGQLTGLVSGLGPVTITVQAMQSGVVIAE